MRRETAAEEEKDSYFPLLDKIAAGEFAKETTDEALYSRFLQVAQQEGFLTDTVTLSSFNLALSINSAAPRIEAHYRYYEDTLEPVMGASYKPQCRVWLQWSQKQHCAKSIESMVSTWERFPKFVAPSCPLMGSCLTGIVTAQSLHSIECYRQNQIYLQQFFTQTLRTQISCTFIASLQVLLSGVFFLIESGIERLRIQSNGKYYLGGMAWNWP